ncbi:HAD superfamily hydrolase (TIGR01509 family) [Rheinheimera pacifica]|uniref:HAD-IA family hydrolase n=1 Tax=Rheinheimera pacifica TaxID=173990 RepID=UPI0021695D77|nr:HAD-IA family hydrolase [Rheinheimera pacifica]MCS4307654.1 HAD superfamily hydrolase (TIGR01509 family) [Rheinheimera pacifica]
MARLCLLFDSDGTLVDSEWLCNQALALLFARYNVQLNVVDLMRDYRGGELQRIFDQLAAQHNVTLNSDSEAWYRAKVAELFAQQLQPVAGIPELLAWVQQQGWPCAVVSNGPQSKLQQALSRCQLLPFFNGHIYSAYDIDIFKPDPRLYLHAAAQLGSRPEQCVVIEDSLPGVKAGVAAGMTTIFYNLHNETSPSTDVIEIKHISEIKAILAGVSKGLS